MSNLPAKRFAETITHGDTIALPSPVCVCVSILPVERFGGTGKLPSQACGLWEMHQPKGLETRLRYHRKPVAV